MSKPKSTATEHRAAFEHPSGRFRLMTDYTWLVSSKLSKEVRKKLADHPASDFVHPDINNWEPYVKKIAEITGAKIIEMVPYPDYPPDTVF
jgi:hypothetical protein